MTDKEKIEKTYEKIKKNYPDITNKEEINNLAIKLDKRNTLLYAVGFFLLAVACCVLYFFLMINDYLEGTRYALFIAIATLLFESIHTLGKYSKIEQKYRPVFKLKYEGQLTKEKILRDGGKILKKAEYAFDIMRLSLCDKEDRPDSESVKHEYYMYFRRTDNNLQYTYKANREQYYDAVIGVDYLAVVTPDSQVAAVYQETNWSIDKELKQYFFDEFYGDESIETKPEAIKNEPVEYSPVTNNIYQPNSAKISTETTKTKKLLPILSIVLIALSFFLPIIIAVPIAIAALVLSIIGLASQRTTLSVTAMVITVISFLVLIAFVVVTIIDLL